MIGENERRKDVYCKKFHYKKAEKREGEEHDDDVVVGCDYMNIGVLSPKFHDDCIHIITVFLFVYLRWVREEGCRGRHMIEIEIEIEMNKPSA